MSFEEKLAVGKVAEGLISQWLQARGHSVLPAYEIEKSSGKGPQLFTAEGDFVSPDLLTFSHKGIYWVEAKHKSVFTWHRNTQQWTTGVDLRHYLDYLNVSKQTKLPVWLMFFHRESCPSDNDRKFGCPAECPTGLFGGELFGLVACENHRAPHFDTSRTGFVGHGRSGMVYWSAASLKLLATTEQVYSAAMEMKTRRAA